MTNYKTEHILTMESITAAQVEYTYCQKLGYPTSKHCDAFNWPRLFDDGFVDACEMTSGASMIFRPLFV